MIGSDNTIVTILKDLSNVHDNLYLLSEDIWNSIDHNDSEKLDEGYQFKKEFNRLLNEFEKNKDAISVLVSQFTGVKVPEKIEEVVEKDTEENKRRVKDLDRNIPHEITENFTSKRPTAFIFDGCAYVEMNCWSDLYAQFVACLAKRDSIKLKSIADNPDYVSSQNKKYFSSNPEDLRKSKKIINDFFVEINLNANDFAKRIMELLEFFDMKKSDIRIYLRQDRNA